MNQVDPDHQVKQMGWWLHAAGGLAALAILLGAEFCINRPIDRRTDANMRRVDKLRSLLRDEDRVRQEHAQAGDELQAAKEMAAMLNRRIPDEPCEADVLAQVSQLADEKRLQLRDYRPGESIHPGIVLVVASRTHLRGRLRRSLQLPGRALEAAAARYRSRVGNQFRR